MSCACPVLVLRTGLVKAAQVKIIDSKSEGFD